MRNVDHSTLNIVYLVLSKSKSVIFMLYL